MPQRSPESGFDVAVIGAGVVGLAAAASLARPGRSVLVLEQDSGIARGITSRNSEVVHAGIYYPPGSLKAELCARGRERLYAWCAEKRVEARRLGKLIVATRAEEESVLEDLLARGRANGVADLEMIDARAIARLEPSVAASQALLSPQTGIVDAHGLCLSLLADAESRGAVLSLSSRVSGLEARPHGWRIEIVGADDGIERVDVGVVVDAAGLAADSMARLAGFDIETLGWRQHPCKGDYFALAPSVRLGLERLIYPVPQSAGLGIHATLDMGNRIRFGPDVEYVDAIDFEVDPAKATTFEAAIRRYLPGLPEGALVPDYSGIRPKLAGPGEGFRDFVVEECSAFGAPGFVACLGIESPGLTAALAIGERLAARL